MGFPHFPMVFLWFSYGFSLTKPSLEGPSPPPGVLGPQLRLRTAAPAEVCLAHLGIFPLGGRWGPESIDWFKGKS